MRRWGLWLAGVLLALYVAYPYVTLWRLDQAILKADIPTLNTLIDWPELRQRLKAEAKLALIDKARDRYRQRRARRPVRRRADRVAGADRGGQRRGRDGHAGGLVHNDKIDRMRHEGRSLFRFVTYAFFASPTEFRVDLKDPDEKELADADQFA